MRTWTYRSCIQVEQGHTLEDGVYSLMAMGKQGRGSRLLTWLTGLAFEFSGE
jgi:hypothetical protein